jgi:hypothetical protein
MFVGCGSIAEWRPGRKYMQLIGTQSRGGTDN